MHHPPKWSAQKLGATCQIFYPFPTKEGPREEHQEKRRLDCKTPNLLLGLTAEVYMNSIYQKGPADAEDMIHQCLPPSRSLFPVSFHT